MREKNGRKIKTHAGSQSHLVAVWSVLSGRDICQNLSEIFAVLMVPQCVRSKLVFLVPGRPEKTPDFVWTPCMYIKGTMHKQISTPVFFAKKVTHG